MYEKKALKIVVDAPHGAGKDECIRFLYLLLAERGFNVLVCPELFVIPDKRYCNLGDPKGDPVGFMAAEMLFFVNNIYRALYVREHEKEFDIILLNRSHRSLKIYLDRCADPKIIGAFDMVATLFRFLILQSEDLVFYLHVEMEENLRRIRARFKDLPERKKWNEDDEEYLQFIYTGYETYFKHDSNVVTIDVTKRDKESTAKAVVRELDARGLTKGAKY